MGTSLSMIIRAEFTFSARLLLLLLSFDTARQRRNSEAEKDQGLAQDNLFINHRHTAQLKPSQAYWLAYDLQHHSYTFIERNTWVRDQDIIHISAR